MFSYNLLFFSKFEQHLYMGLFLILLCNHGFEALNLELLEHEGGCLSELILRKLTKTVNKRSN